MRNVRMVEARKLCGKTQEAVAKEVGISTLAFQRYEGGQRTPSVATAIRIADALGVEDLRVLFGQSSMAK